MTAQPLPIPRLTILQATSPLLNPDHRQYVEGACAGWIYNGQGKLYDGPLGVLLVIASLHRGYLQQWPYNSTKGKGFIKNWGSDSYILDGTRYSQGQYLMPDGSEIVKAADFFALLVNESTGEYERVTLQMVKSQYDKAKHLATIASALMVSVNGHFHQAPLFYRAYQFKTRPESNDRGTWFGWGITPGPALLDNPLDLEVLPHGEQIYMAAHEFRSEVREQQEAMAKR